MSLHALDLQNRIHDTNTRNFAPLEPGLAPLTVAELAPQAQVTPEQHPTPSFISRVKSFGNFLIGRHITS
jgi:hypothetical protein